MDKKRKHHYVWRNYLKSWTIDETIYCLRMKEKKLFNTGLMAIAQIKDFYRFEKLNNLEKELLYKLFIKNNNDIYETMNSSWFSLFNSIHTIHDLVRNSNLENDAIEREYDIAINNIIEEYHSIIENNSIKILEKLNNDEIDILEEDNNISNFLYYLAVQYFRTYKMQNEICNILSEIEGIDGGKIWIIGSIIFATNLGLSLFLDRKKFKNILLKTNGLEFITSDQPVINTMADYKKKKVLSDEEIEIYYPLSPESALLITKKVEKFEENIKDITDSDVQYYNNLIFNAAHEQIFAREKNSLKIFNEIC